MEVVLFALVCFISTFCNRLKSEKHAAKQDNYQGLIWVKICAQDSSALIWFQTATKYTRVYIVR